MEPNERVPVSQAELTRVVSDLVEEVARRESGLGATLPVDRAVGIDDCLRLLVDAWSSGERAMRTHPVVNTYEGVFDRPIDGDLCDLLVALDAEVVTFDDVIDTRRPTRREKICASAVLAFTGLVELRALPPQNAAAIADVLSDYWVALAQIPAVERRMMDALRGAGSAEEMLAAGELVYGYRGRDIDAFVQIPQLVHGVDGAGTGPYLEDLRAFRARYQLFEDFRHIRRDLQEGHANPAIVVMNVVDDPAEAVAVVEALYDLFAYSSDAEGRYAGRLRAMERRPAALEQSVRESMRVLTGEFS